MLFLLTSSAAKIEQKRDNPQQVGIITVNSDFWILKVS